MDEGQRSQWLTDPDFTLRKANPEKSLRIGWADGRSSLDVYFYELGPAKSRVTINHKKLPGAEDAERMKANWQDHLGRLKAYLETAGKRR